MNKLILLIAILIKVQLSNAQITFQKTFGGYITVPWFSYTGSNGNTAFAGDIYSTGFFLLSVNAAGDTVFSNGYSGFGFLSVRDAAPTLDGGYIMSINEKATTSLIDSSSLVKTDSAGTVQWVNRYMHSTDTINAMGPVLQTSDSGYFFAFASISQTTFGSYGMYLVKADATGNAQWVMRDSTAISFASNNLTTRKCLMEIPGQGYVIAGQTPVNLSSDDMLLLKINSTGSLVWAMHYGTSGNDNCIAAMRNSKGNFMLIGGTDGLGAGGKDIYLVCTDNNGQKLWSKTYGGTGDDVAYDIIETADGGFAICGSTYSFGAGQTDALLIRTDSTGAVLWANTYGQTFTDFTSTLSQTPDGGFLMGGTFSATQNFHPGYLIKTDAMGNSGCYQTPAAISVSNPADVEGSKSVALTPDSINNYTGVLNNYPYTDVTAICSSTGTGDMAMLNKILVYPNPANTKVTISFDKVVKGKFEITNSIGYIIFSENIFNESEKEISLKIIAGGIYFVKVFDGEKSYCKKLIVERD